MGFLSALDVESLPAGPEMDALVAQRVMGLYVLSPMRRAVFGGPESSYPLLAGAIIDGAKAGDCVEIDTFDSRYRNIPPYSTSEAAAAQVTVQLLKSGFDVKAGEDGDGWVAFVVKPAGLDEGIPTAKVPYGPIRAESRPLAICRAALKAVGV